MKVSDAIKMLTEYNQPDDEIVFVCWAKYHFDGIHIHRTGKELTDGDWAAVVHIMDSRGLGEYESSTIYDQIDEMIMEVTEKGN